MVWPIIPGSTPGRESLMLGQQLLASQTCGLFRLYDATVGEVQGSPVRWLGLCFLWFKSCIRPFCGAKQWPEVTVLRLRKFASEYPNALLPVRCLLSNECSLLNAAGNCKPDSPGGVCQK